MTTVTKATRKVWSVASGLTDDLLSLFYPNICQACGRPLVRGEQAVCLICRVDLPETGYHQYLDNPVAKKFWGRVTLSGATTLYHFRKGSKVQQLLHRFKYQSKRDIGIKLGNHFGLQLKNETPYRDAEVIVPVPLHKRKEHKRGYNQSTVFAEGLAERMGIGVLRHALVREVHTDSQTKRARFERWENVETVFRLKKPEVIEGKHIMLVDDVITTGATIEACAAELVKAPGVTVCVVAIASPL